MTEEQIYSQIKPFVDACDKMTASKFIMIDKRVSDVLKAIASVDLVFDEIKECMINFNFEKEFRAATSKAGYLYAPEEAHKFIAFTFSLLNYLDDKKLSASDLLSRYYSKTEDPAGPYSEFCQSIIVRFKNTLVSKIMTKSEVIREAKKPEVVIVDKDVLSRLAFLLKDLKDYVQGLKKIKKGSLTKGELQEVIGSAICCVKNGDVKYIRAFITAIKAGEGKEKEIDKRLCEILDIVNKSFPAQEANMTDQERYDEINQQLDALYNACANEYAELVKPEGFDLYSEKNQKKVQELTARYAKYISPLQLELNEIVDRLSKQAEAENAKKYVDEAEAEKILAKKKLKNRK